MNEKMKETVTGKNSIPERGHGLREDDILAYSPSDQVQIAIQENKDAIPWTNTQQHALAWNLLAHVLAYDGSWQELEAQTVREEKGKPYLPGSSLQFNLSHCSQAVAVICAPVPAGIDIERIRPYREKLARRICHPREWELFEKLTEEKDKEKLFSRIWSRKESLLKAGGEGLSVNLQTVLVWDEAQEKAEILSENKGADWSASACPGHSGAGYTFFEKTTEKWTCCAAVQQIPSRHP